MSPFHERHPSETVESKISSSDQFGSCSNANSVQALSKQKVGRSSAEQRPRYAKTDIRYWHKAVFKPSYTQKGVARQTFEWAIKVQHLGHRETLPLGTANRAAAAAKAKQIYLSLKSRGWEETLGLFKPRPSVDAKSVTTVGQFLEQAASVCSARPTTIVSYCRAFRLIVAGVFDFSAGPERFNYRPGSGREKWLARIHGVPLARITPAKVQQ